MGTTYSHSRVGCFETCPQQYKFKYIEKPAIPRRDTPDTFLGRAVHQVLQTLYKAGADGVVISLDDAVQEYRKYWSRANLTHMVVLSEHYTVDDYIRIGEEMLRRHHEKYHPFDQGQLLGTELRLRFELPGTSIKFLAIVDKLWRRDDDVVEITDYKTGKSLPSPGDARFVSQMGLYQMAVKANHPQFEKIELAQLFVRQDELVSCQLREDQLDELAERLRSSVMGIENAIRLDSFPTNESRMCDYCDFVTVCPAKRHAALLEDDDDDARSEAEKLRDLADTFLEKNDVLKGLKSEVDALKSDLKDAAQTNGFDRIAGTKGDVTIKLSTVEKFITKTKDAAAFADLNHVVRELGLEDYLTVDSTALMKQIYAKHRLPDEQLERLREFVTPTTTARISAKWREDQEREE
jgi:RecB family exonuclease